MHCRHERVRTTSLSAQQHAHGETVRTMPQIMAISSDGYFYAYSIDLETGGECVLMKQYRCAFFVSVSISYHNNACFCSLLDAADESVAQD